jgi:hypothetical protein
MVLDNRKDVEFFEEICFKEEIPMWFQGGFKVASRWLQGGFRVVSGWIFRVASGLASGWFQGWLQGGFRVDIQGGFRAGFRVASRWLQGGYSWWIFRVDIQGGFRGGGSPRGGGTPLGWGVPKDTPFVGNRVEGFAPKVQPLCPVGKVKRMVCR